MNIRIVIEFLTSAYLIATVLNLSFSKRWHLNVKQVQNLIGISLLTGLILYYFIELYELTIAANSDTAYSFCAFPDKGPPLYTMVFMQFYPLFVLFLNLKRSWRIKPSVFVLSSLMFLPRFYELFAYATTPINNKFGPGYYVLYSLAEMVISGIVLYLFFLGILKLLDKNTPTHRDR